MRLIGLLCVFAIIAIIAMGFYLGWFRFSSANNGDKSNVTMTVNQAKIRSDKNKIVGDMHNLKPANSTPPTTPSASAPAATPVQDNSSQ